MSELWTYSSSSPIMHHSSVSQSSPFSSSPPPVFSSSSSLRNHGNSLHEKMTSHHLPHLQTQLTSSHYLPHPQVTSPHLPHHQVTSPHLQVTSPHLPHPQVTSPHLPQPQVTSPHYQHQHQVTSPHHLPHAQVTSPHLLPHAQVTSPHLLLSSHNHDAGLDHSNWAESEPQSDLSYLLNNYNYSYQNQDASYMDFHLQNQNQNQNQSQFSVDLNLNHHRHTNPLLYEPQTPVSAGMFGHGDSPGPDVDPWGPVLPQMQCSPLGSVSGSVHMGRQSSVEFRSTPTEDFSNNHFFPYGYHDNNASQPYCSPSTPGPSPHYPQTPQTPAISSPGPQMHPRTETLPFQTQTPTQLNRDQTTSCCLHESDSYPATSDPVQHQLSRNVLPSQTEPVQNQSGVPDAAGSLESCFPPQGRGQDVSSPAQPAGLNAGLSWGNECGGGRRRGRGGGGGGRGGGGGGDSQPDWNWVKQAQHENLPKAPDPRLLCTVCKRDFRSLPALNGHMRSHSGFRSASWLNKGNTSPPVSMVMPVSVPVQTRGASKVSRAGPQRKCTRQSSAAGGAVLYCSLMRVDAAKEEAVAKGVARGDGGRGHYTPPPMLCPVRTGPGLHCSLTTRRQQRVQILKLHNSQNGLSDVVSMETAPPSPVTPTTGTNKPRINVGQGYQVEVPPLQDRKHAHSDSHNALQLWTPLDMLEHPANEQRVETLLTMACSGVVPGGGTSPEFTLNILSECRGDILLTVEKLLSTPESSDNSHSAGVRWSPAERKLMVKSLQLHQKDFSSVQKAVQTKSLPQCVEFYYLWKKKLSLSARTTAGLTVALPDKNGQRS
ncbi:uncharacterized protein LOC121892409 [Scomber scombrus]|uniref:Uncharacterized protein LOC121892409 n=1 Tax=Scomber scombrus TaxID=13677 RepID=A0AAV1QF64_SCOSC